MKNVKFASQEPNVPNNKSLEFKDSSEIIFSLCKEDVNLQIQQRNSLETKANTLIGFSGVMFALIITALDKILVLDIKTKCFILIGVFLFVLSIIMATIVSWVSHYYLYPDLSVLFSNYFKRNSEETKLELIKRFTEDGPRNYKVLEKKAVILRIAYFLQLLGFLSFAIALCFAL